MAEEKTTEKVRVDKWLWSVRIFKSRSLAGEVCRQGHVKLNGKTLKPSAGVEEGMLLQVRRNGYNMQYKVLKLISKRGGAPIANTCYEDLTPEEELKKFDDWFIGKSGAERREKGAGRPTKRERREIEGFKGSNENYDWGWVDEDEDF